MASDPGQLSDQSDIPANSEVNEVVVNCVVSEDNLKIVWSRNYYSSFSLCMREYRMYKYSCVHSLCSMAVLRGFVRSTTEWQSSSHPSLLAHACWVRWSYVNRTLDINATWFWNTDIKVLFLFERRICSIGKVNRFPFVPADSVFG